MGQLIRYLKGSPGVYEVVGLVIKRLTKHGYFPSNIKFSESRSLRIGNILATLPHCIVLPEMIRRYFKEEPMEYKLIGYYTFERAAGDYNSQTDYNSQLRLSATPLEVLPLLNDMARAAI